MTPPRDEIEDVRRDLIRHGEAISSIVTDARNTKEELWTVRAGVETSRQVRLLADEHLNERFDDIDKRFDSVEKKIGYVTNLLLSAIGVFGAAFAVAVANFIMNGGLKVP